MEHLRTYSMCHYMDIIRIKSVFYLALVALRGLIYTARCSHRVLFKIVLNNDKRISFRDENPISLFLAGFGLVESVYYRGTTKGTTSNATSMALCPGLYVVGAFAAILN